MHLEFNKSRNAICLGISLHICDRASWGYLQIGAIVTDILFVF